MGRVNAPTYAYNLVACGLKFLGQESTFVAVCIWVLKICFVYLFQLSKNVFFPPTQVQDWLLWFLTTPHTDSELVDYSDSDS
jgi:hypothetical protein